MEKRKSSSSAIVVCRVVASGNGFIVLCQLGSRSCIHLSLAGALEKSASLGRKTDVEQLNVACTSHRRIDEEVSARKDARRVRF